MGVLSRKYVSGGETEYYLFDVSDNMVYRVVFPETIVADNYVGFYVQVSGNRDERTGSLQVASISTKQAGVSSLSSLPQAVTGTIKILAILVEFSDVKHSTSHSPSYYSTLMSTMSSYYNEISYGKVSLSVTVAGSRWYTSSHTMAYYGADSDCTNNPGGDDQNGAIHQLTREAVALADPDVDFSTFDSDGNSVVDHLTVIHAGSGQESSASCNDIWSHQWEVGWWVGGVCLWDCSSADGKSIRGYFMEAESSPVGTFAHEFGHDLGLPDLYEYAPRTDPDNFVGKWELMASGSWNDGGDHPAHMSSWSRTRLGWISASEIFTVNSGQNYDITIDPLEIMSPTFYRAAKIPLSGGTYYLVEVRQKTGYDAYLPDEGVLIYLVDESKTSGHGIVRVKDANPSTGTYDDAAWKVGKEFSDNTNQVYITVHRASSASSGAFEMWIANQPPGGVDLIVVSVSPDPPNPAPGDSIMILVTIRNIRLANPNSPDGFVEVNLYLDGEYKGRGGFADFVVTTGKDCITGIGEWPITAGSHVLKAIVNEDHSTPESNYLNNELTYRFPVGWVLLDGPTPDALASTASSPLLFLGARGMENGIWYRGLGASGTWSSWNRVPGFTDVRPAVAVFNSRLYFVCKEAGTSRIWFGYYPLSGGVVSGAFSGWTMLDGPTPTALGLAADSSYLYLAAAAPGGSIWHRRMDTSGTWSAWVMVPGLTDVSPAISIFNNRLYFACKEKSTNRIWYGYVDLASYPNGWSGWTFLSGPTPDALTLTASSDTLYLAARGMENGIWYRSMNTGGSWSSWSGLSGFTDARPAIAVFNAQLRFVCKEAGSNNIWYC